ncbi:MAG: hypothetical protein LBG84_02315 [Treponema sp.]|jgi:hypothetical protein|nr:hypothetical protein [Treponema sp.]
MNPRPRPLAAAALAAGLFLSCVSTPYGPPEPAQIPEDFFGVSPDRSPLEKEDFDLLDQLGTVWTRTTLRWSSVEPREGTWNFQHADNYVSKTVSAGKKLVYILGFDNPWLYQDRREHRDMTDREIPYFLAYTEQVVSRYRGKVAAFEIWNEPNWVFWKGSDEHFFALSRAAAAKARETDPHAVILAGSTARFSRRFTRGMIAAGALEHTDGFSIHPYSLSPRGTIRQVDKLRKLLDKADYRKPIWITEAGYATGGISPIRLDRYGAYIVKTLSGLAARSGAVRNVIWYELMDEYVPSAVPDHWNFEHFFGLIYPDRTLKPGARAFMLTAHHLAGAEYRPEFPRREGVFRGLVSLYFRKKDGTRVLLLWTESGDKRRIRLILEGAAGVFRQDIHGGPAVPLSADPEVEVGGDPLFVTWRGEAPPLIRPAGKNRRL